MTLPSNIAQFAKRVERFTVDNSPLLLTVVGVTGTLTTAILTGKASFKAASIIEDERYTRSVNRTLGAPEIELTLKEKINLVWTQYIPAVGVGSVTIAAVVGANHIGTRRAAALAAAYSVSEKAFNEYKEKVVERIGEKKEQVIRDDLAQDRVRANPASEREIIVMGRGQTLCFEHFTGRYFETSMEELKKAQNDLNYRINHDMYASLSDFYDLLGLPHTSVSDEIGWTGDKLMELDFSTVLSDEGDPCLAIDYRVAPIRNYYRMG